MLSEKIATIHRNSRATYGAPRVHAELRTLGIRCAKKRVARLMRRAGLRGCLRGRRMRTTHRKTFQQAAAPDLVNRNFASEEPDQLWVADITYVRSGEGFLYLAFILDACSRKIVGWSIATHLRSELVVDALQMAIARRKPAPGLVHHSDRGVQYTSLSFGKKLEDEGLVPSVSAFDGPGGNRLRQRSGRIVRGYAEDGAPLPERLAYSPGGKDGALRVHRVLLQRPKKALCSRISQPGRVRGG